jgi:zinc and cadmium transporter
MIVVGDAFHNFVDGVLIASAFIESHALGLVAATAVIVHQIPQAVGDYLVLVHSGYGRARALAMNLVASLAMLAGAWATWFGLRGEPSLLSTFVALAAASMIYVAVADLIPGLHRRPELSATLRQVVLIAAGIGLIAVMGLVTHAH